MFVKTRTSFQKLLDKKPLRITAFDDSKGLMFLRKFILLFRGNEKLHISSEDYHKLKMFREARNRLAHLCILSDQEMEDIFSVF